MKKLFILLSTAMLSLTGCNKSNPTKLDEAIYNFQEQTIEGSYSLELSVLAPTGAPAISLYSFATSDKLTTTTDPQTGLMPMFIKGNYDVIVAPTNGGLKQIINNGAQYKIAATVTFGNFFIVATGTDSDNTLNSGDKVIAFQENDIPGKVFKYLYGDKGLNVTYVAGAANTKQIMENNGLYDGVQYDYVYTAEPVMSASNKTSFINVRDEFKAKSGNKMLTQASVFIKNGTDELKANKFLSVLKSSITAGLANPDLFKSEIEKLGSVAEQQNKFGVPGAMAKKVGVNNGFGLGFEKASDIKEDIKNFIGIISPEIEL